MSLHLRSEWTDTPGSCSAPFHSAEVLGVAVHWNGTLVTRSTPEQLRLDRRYHIEAKGWCDIAYNLAVDQSGDVWECRGLHLRSSANGSTESNRLYVAVVALIGQSNDGSIVQQPSPQMLQGFRDAIDLVREWYPNATQIATHNDVRPERTACPGPDLTAAVRAGSLEPQEDDMPLTPEERTVLDNIAHAVVPVYEIADSRYQVRTIVTEQLNALVMPSLAALLAQHGQVAELTDAALADIATAVNDELARRQAG